MESIKSAAGTVAAYAQTGLDWAGDHARGAGRVVGQATGAAMGGGVGLVGGGAVGAAVGGAVATPVGLTPAGAMVGGGAGLVAGGVAGVEMGWQVGGDVGDTIGNIAGTALHSLAHPVDTANVIGGVLKSTSDQIHQTFNSIVSQ